MGLPFIAVVGSRGGRGGRALPTLAPMPPAADLGFTGWRFDFSRGYAARFTKEYVEATTGKDAFNVGEFWTDLKW